MAKCIVCAKTKGKRGCLVKDKSLICSRCCAEMRNSECEGCSYYKESENFAIEKASKAKKNSIVRIDPEIDDEIDRALMMAQSGKIAKGEAIIRSLMKDNADLYSVQFAMGVINSIKEQHDEAMDYYDKSIAIYPYFVDCWFNRALTAQKKMDVLEMLISYRSVIEYGEKNDEAVLMANEFITHFEQITHKETGLGIDDYMESLQQFNTAFNEMEKQQWKNAIVGFKKSISINPTAPQAFGNMALCYANLNENEQAIEAFDKAIEIDSSYEPAINNKKILVKAMAKGHNFSESQAEMVAIEYRDGYSVKGNKLFVKGKQDK